MRFSELPNELLLAVAQSCDPFTIEELRFASKRLMALSRKIPRNLRAMQLLSFEAVLSDQKQMEEDDLLHDEGQKKRFEAVLSDQKQMEEDDLLHDEGQKKRRDYVNEHAHLKEIYLDGSWKEDVYTIWDEARSENDECLYYNLFSEITAVRKIHFSGMYVHYVFYIILWFGKILLPKLRHLRELKLYDCDLRDIPTLMRVLQHINQLEILEITQCNVSRSEFNCMDCITNEIILSVRKRFILDIKDKNDNNDDYIENFSQHSMQDLEEINTAKVNSEKAGELIRRVNTCKNIDDSLLDRLKENPICTIELPNINSLITVGAIVKLVEDFVNSDNEVHWNFGNVKNDGFETLPRLFNIADLHCNQKPIHRFEKTSLFEEIQQFEITTSDGKKTFIFASDIL